MATDDVIGPTTDLAIRSPGAGCPGHARTVDHGKPDYSPFVDQTTEPLWGDTHLHTAASLGAFAYGDTLGAEDAYRFARGEEVRSSSGQHVRLSRPLDWLVIADHSEFSGIGIELYQPALRA